MHNKKLVRCALASTVAIGALLWNASAFAQEAADAPSSGGGLEEIIVTAQRRGENLQDVPIAVNALTAAQLKTMGGTSSEDFNLIPGVVYNASIAGGGITIRGISGTNGGTDEPANAIYVDGVYQFAATAGLFQFNGIERIEILKGPQGTLFGRNTAGGVVQIITRDPGRVATAEAQVGYANYDTYSGNAYLSVPLGDSLAANLAVFGTDQKEGWGRNVFTGKETHKGYSYGAHGKLKWVAPGGGTDVILSGLYTKERPVASATGTLAPGLLSAIVGQPSPGIFNEDSDINAFRTTEHYTFSGTIHHDMGGVRLTSITAYDTAIADVITDADVSPAPVPIVQLHEKFTSFTQELQLQSKNDSPLQWIVGAFYLKAKAAGEFVFPGSAPINVDIWTRSYAGFGQATYAITDTTKLTAGIRYTSDRRRMESPVTDPQYRTDGKPSWRLAIDHKFSEDVMGYASYSRGFKSGVFNATTPNFPAAGPTKLDAFEVGLKSEMFQRRLRVNAAVFYYDYQNIQIELFTQNSQGAYFQSAGAARTYGLDLDVTAEPVRNLTLTGGVALLDAKFTSTRLAPCFTIPAPPAGGLIQGECALKGNQQPFSPKFTASLAANYKHETEIGTFDLAGSFSHNSGFHTHPSNFAPARVRAFEMVNAALTWTSPSERLNASIWGKNLLDQHRIGGSLINAPFGGLVFPMAPRTYGVTFGVKY